MSTSRIGPNRTDIFMSSDLISISVRIFFAYYQPAADHEAVRTTVI